jgi:hypothetical protein
MYCSIYQKSYDLPSASPSSLNIINPECDVLRTKKCNDIQGTANTPEDMVS